jgi:hypothetical protein
MCGVSLDDQPFSRSSETKISLIGTISLFIGCKSAYELRCGMQSSSSHHHLIL